MNDPCFCVPKLLEVRSEVRLDDHLMEFGIFAFVQIDLSLAYVTYRVRVKERTFWSLRSGGIAAC